MHARRWLVFLVLLAGAAVPARAELDDSTLWDGYEMVRVGGDMIIRPSKPNPPGDPPLACQRLLAKDIANYDRVAKRWAAKPGVSDTDRYAQRAGLALGFLKLIALNEVSTSGGYPGKPNAYRPVREALEAALGVKSRVVADRAPGLSKKGYSSDVQGKEPGRRQLAKFDEYMNGLVGGLEKMQAEVARREADGTVDPPEVQPPSVARSARPDAAPVAEASPGAPGATYYVPPRQNPPGEPPAQLLTGLYDIFVQYENENGDFERKLAGIREGVDQKAKELGQNRGLNSTRAQAPIDREWFKRGKELLRRIAAKEAYTGQSVPDVHNPFRADREQLERILGVTARVVLDKDTGGVAQLQPDTVPTFPVQQAKDFRSYMEKRRQDLPAMKAKIDAAKGSSEE